MKTSTRQNAYERLKANSAKASNFNMGSLAKKEETYWAGAAVPAVLFAGLVDGGVTMALAYGARKLYEINNSK